MATIRVIQGDITKQAVDAIVNAANTSLIGGGASTVLFIGPLDRNWSSNVECFTVVKPATRRLPRAIVCQQSISFMPLGQFGRVVIMASCYRRALEIASASHLTSIAFPNISTGIYGYPKDKAADVAMTTVTQFLEQPTSVLTIFLCASRQTMSFCMSIGYQMPINIHCLDWETAFTYSPVAVLSFFRFCFLTMYSLAGWTGVGSFMR